MVKNMYSHFTSTTTAYGTRNVRRPATLARLSLNINNIEKTVSIDHTKHKKIPVRINSTFNVIRACMFILLSVREVTQRVPPTCTTKTSRTCVATTPDATDQTLLACSRAVPPHADPDSGLCPVILGILVTLGQKAELSKKMNFKSYHGQKEKLSKNLNCQKLSLPKRIRFKHNLGQTKLALYPTW